MADVVKALALHAEIGLDPVQDPETAPKKNGHWEAPLHRRCPNDPQVTSGRQVNLES